MSPEQLIAEQATVIRREEASLWVAANRSSACASCRVKSGCGTSLLAKLGSESVAVRALIPATLADLDFTEGEGVEIAVDRYAFVKVSLLIYLLPLSGLLLGVMIAGVAVAEASFTKVSADFTSAVFAIAGLFLGGVLSRALLKYWHNSELLQPIVLRKALREGEVPVIL